MTKFKYQRNVKAQILEIWHFDFDIDLDFGI